MSSVRGFIGYTVIQAATGDPAITIYKNSLRTFVGLTLDFSLGLKCFCIELNHWAGEVNCCCNALWKLFIFLKGSYCRAKRLVTVCWADKISLDISPFEHLMSNLTSSVCSIRREWWLKRVSHHQQGERFLSLWHPLVKSLKRPTAESNPESSSYNHKLICSSS